MKIEIDDKELIKEIVQQVVEQIKPMFNGLHGHKGDELIFVCDDVPIHDNSSNS